VASTVLGNGHIKIKNCELYGTGRGHMTDHCSI
jgi:hypothetical protein